MKGLKDKNITPEVVQKVLGGLTNVWVDAGFWKNSD